MTIYLDHQASTPANQSVIDAMQPFWRDNFGNPHSSEHIVGWNANSSVQNSKEIISEVLGSEPDEIFFYSGATEANNHSIFAMSALSKNYPERKRIIISEIEHKCVLESSIYWAEEFGLELCFLKVNKIGMVDLEQLNELLEVPTLYCSIMYVNNEIGVIQNITKIAGLLKNAGVLFHSDCAQALKAVDLENLSEQVDIATFSGHKIGGPQGIGCSFISSELQDWMLAQILGGGQQQNLRSGTLALPLVVGLAEAFRNMSEKDLNDKNKLNLLNKSEFLWEELKKKNANIELNGPELNLRHPGNLNICFPGVLASDLLLSLQPHICASSGSACSSGSIEPSYVLLALGYSTKHASCSVRFSVGVDTSRIDLKNAANMISKKYKEIYNHKA